MNNAVMIISAVIAVISLTSLVVTRIKTRRIIKNIDKMLDKAIDGSFTQTEFSENELSALENKLWQYLSSSEISVIKTAEEKEKIKTLIADISHQTKTPVANIMLYSELLSEGELLPEQKEYTDKIRNQSEKLSFLITSLVKLSRLEAGIISLNPKENTIKEILADIVSQAESKAEAKGLTITLSCGSEKAVFDEKWTAEALWNILDNAVKYTDKGKIDVSVKDYDMFLRIDISDTGKGIPEEEQAQIFSRFYRSPASNSEEGLGIGLHLSRQIITAQNGYIKVTSDEQKGSVFSVFLSKL